MNVRLVTNPSTDGSFRRRAESSLSERARTPAELEQSLKDEYPRVTVVSGITEQDSERWYAYREGRWIDPSAPDGHRQRSVNPQPSPARWSYRGAEARTIR